MDSKRKDWLEFEHEVRDLVECFGYRGLSTPPSGDLGVDVLAERGQKAVVIQCKLYGKGNIGSDHIMKLVGSKAYFKAQEAICITTSGFTKSAREVAENAGVHLVDRAMLLLLCKEKGATIPTLTALVDEAGRRYPLTDASVSVGRVESNTIALDNPYVSKAHALLTREKLLLYVSDRGSTNGTWVIDLLKKI